MPNLDTTNLILGVIAVAALLQSLLFLWTALLMRRQITAFGDAISRLTALDLPALSQRAQKVADDVHHIAAATARAGREIERTARSANAVVQIVGHEVDRATGGVRLTFDVIEKAAGQVIAIVAGLKEGTRELLFGRARNVPRRIDAGNYPATVQDVSPVSR